MESFFSLNVGDQCRRAGFHKDPVWFRRESASRTQVYIKTVAGNNEPAPQACTARVVKLDDQSFFLNIECYESDESDATQIMRCCCGCRSAFGGIAAGGGNPRHYHQSNDRAAIVRHEDPLGKRITLDFVPDERPRLMRCVSFTPDFLMDLVGEVLDALGHLLRHLRELCVLFQ